MKFLGTFTYNLLVLGLIFALAANVLAVNCLDHLFSQMTSGHHSLVESVSRFDEHMAPQRHEHQAEQTYHAQQEDQTSITLDCQFGVGDGLSHTSTLIPAPADTMASSATPDVPTPDHVDTASEEMSPFIKTFAISPPVGPPRSA